METVPVAEEYQVTVPEVQVAESVMLLPAQILVGLIETAVGFSLTKVKGTTKLQVPFVTLAYKVCEPDGMVLFAVKIFEA